MATRESKGVIEIIKDASTKQFTKKDETTGSIHSIGIKLKDGDWHNIQSFNNVEECNKVLDKLDGGKFVVGDNVIFNEESDKSGKYWNIKGISMAETIQVENVGNVEEMEQKVGFGPENIIEKQCCLKCAAMTGGLTSKEDVVKTAQWYYAQLQHRWLE